jgi:pimeloyl-ACP methyl ester carboxylesterase
MSVIPVLLPTTIPGVSARVRRGLQHFYRLLSNVSPLLAARLALTLFTVPARFVARKAERAVLERAERTRVHVGQQWLRVFHWPGRGPTILLAHGWSSRAARLALLADALVDAGFRVIAFDAPGHGASTGIRSNVLLYREALRAVLERMGPVHAIVGHSLGARVAMLMMRTAATPDVRAVALMGIPPDVGYMFEQFKLVLELRQDVCRLLHMEFERHFGGAPEVHSPGDATCLELPVLVIHDRDDEVAPVDHARNLARQLPRGTLHLTRNLQHCGLLTDPAAIDVVVEFMKRHCLDRTH